MQLIETKSGILSLCPHNVTHSGGDIPSPWHFLGEKQVTDSVHTHRWDYTGLDSLVVISACVCLMDYFKIRRKFNVKVT